MIICQPSKRTILISVCGRHQNGKQDRHNMEPTWKILMKDVDLGEPTSFLDHVNLGCTRWECTKSNDIVTKYRDMFESRISAGVQEKLPTRASLKPDAETISSGSYDMEGDARNCVERKCQVTNSQRLNNYAKSQRPCMDDHQYEEEENEVSRRILYSLLDKLICSVCIWHILVDPKICGFLWINLLGRSLSGQ